MDTVSQKVSTIASKETQESFSHVENPAIQKLLDVVAATLAEEYIQTARQNPDVFKEPK